MKTVLRPLMLAAALCILIPAAGRPVDPLIQCSLCSCRSNCGTPCREGNGTPSACGISGHRCTISPICSEP